MRCLLRYNRQKLFQKRFPSTTIHQVKDNLALYLTYRLQYTIVCNMRHGPSAVNERPEVDIISHHFEILKDDIGEQLPIAFTVWQKLSHKALIYNWGHTNSWYAYSCSFGVSGV